MADLDSNAPARKRSLDDTMDGLIVLLNEMKVELLNGFSVYAESCNRRLTNVEREIAEIKDGVIIIESRLAVVEQRLNMPPAA